MTDEVIIKVENLSKQYGLPLPKILKNVGQSLRGKSLSSEDYWALKDVSFEVKKGETLGIIGSNGAGKSTLLKVLAGVTPATRGKATVKGKIFPMIELNAGIHPELTGRENVRLLGAIMRFSRREIEARLPQIEAFTELGEWFDRPVRKYSSGMLARLGFGVAMNVDADVLLVDEVLAVGDLFFQRKCYNRFEHLRRQEITVILVSHNIRQIERICNQVVFLEGGRILAKGKADDILCLYSEKAYEQVLTRIPRHRDNLHVKGTGGLQVVEAQILNANRVPSQEFCVFENLTIHVEFDVAESIQRPIVILQIYSVDMICVTSVNNVHTVRPSFQPGRVVVECTLLNLRLMPGVYSMFLKVRDGSEAILLSVDQMIQFRVRNESFSLIRTTGGLLHVDHDWRFDC